MKATLKIFSAFLAMLILLSACGKFEEINTNPDQTTIVSPSLLATNVILGMLQFDGRDAKVMISANALPKYVGYANEGQMLTQYNKIGESGFGEMLMLPNIDKMVELSEENVAVNSYKGLAKFARAYMFYNATMQMGDIPYSQANQGADGVYKPVYDSQEAVLTGVLEELREANDFFADGRTFEGDPSPFNGDPLKWQQAVNAFTLRVLMSLSEKTDNTNLDVVNRFSEVVSGAVLFDDYTDFLGLEYSSQNRQPLYSTNDLFTGKTVLSSLLVNHLKDLDDRRLFYLAEPSGYQITRGKTEDDPTAYFGVDVAMDYTTMNAYHSADFLSLINLRYQLDEENEPRILMSYAEQQLVLAEARIKGWISSGNAQDYYEQGVGAALLTAMNIDPAYAHGMAITQEYIDGYFTGEAAFKADEEDQLKQIWLQRYILNFFQDARSSFFEYRRTGYPEFPINPETSLNEYNKDGIPVRWLYPESELKYNSENLIDALDRQFDGFDEINKIMWVLE